MAIKNRNFDECLKILEWCEIKSNKSLEQTLKLSINLKNGKINAKDLFQIIKVWNEKKATPNLEVDLEDKFKNFEKETLKKEEILIDGFLVPNKCLTGNFVTKEYLARHLVEKLDLKIDENNNLVFNENGILITLTKSFLNQKIHNLEIYEYCTLDALDNIFRLLPNAKMPIIPAKNENVINFKNYCFLVKNNKFEILEEKQYGKINLNIDYNNDKNYPLWEKLIKLWHNVENIEEINFVLSSVFWTKDIIKKMRTSLIWNSKGDAGKTTLFEKILKRFQNTNTWGMLERDYTKGTQGSGKNAKTSSVNILDDSASFEINDDVANDQVKNTFSIKNLNTNKETIESYLTTIILCNTLGDKTTTKNSLKKFHFLNTDNIRYDENEKVRKLVEQLDYDKLVIYLFNWFIDKVNKNELMNLKKPLKKEDFESNDYEWSEILEILESNEFKLNCKEYKTRRVLFQMLGFKNYNKKEQKHLRNKVFEYLENSEDFQKRKNGNSVNYKYVGCKEVNILETRRNIKTLQKTETKEIKKSKFIPMTALNGVERGK